jgi:hypothetical protein
MLYGQVVDRRPRGDHVGFSPLVVETLARFHEDLGVESIFLPSRGGQPMA